MAFKKYIKRGGKLYGPYIYESRRQGNKVVTIYKGPASAEKKFIRSQKINLILIISLFAILAILLIYINFPQISQILGKITENVLPSQEDNLLSEQISEPEMPEAIPAEEKQSAEQVAETVEQPLGETATAEEKVPLGQEQKEEKQTEKEKEKQEKQPPGQEKKEEKTEPEEPEIPVSEENITETPENITETNITNVTAPEVPVNITNVTIPVNITNVTERNITKPNITKLNISEQNITEINVTELNVTNATIANVTNITIETIQYSAVIGKPV